MFAIAAQTSGSNWQIFLRKPRVTLRERFFQNSFFYFFYFFYLYLLIMSHKLDLLLLSSLQCDKNIKLLEDLNKDKYRILTAEQKPAQKK